MSTAPAPPDLIFYDMFSTKTSGDQWTLERVSPVVRRLRRACRRTFHLHLLDREPRRAARRRLLRRARTKRRRKVGDDHRAHAGGVSLRHRSCRHELLTPDWLEKWHRSGAKFPGEIQADQHDFVRAG